MCVVIGNMRDRMVFCLVIVVTLARRAALVNNIRISNSIQRAGMKDVAYVSDESRLISHANRIVRLGTDKGCTSKPLEGCTFVGRRAGTVTKISVRIVTIGSSVTIFLESHETTSSDTGCIGGGENWVGTGCSIPLLLLRNQRRLSRSITIGIRFVASESCLAELIQVILAGYCMSRIVHRHITLWITAVRRRFVILTITALKNVDFGEMDLRIQMVVHRTIPGAKMLRAN